MEYEGGSTETDITLEDYSQLGYLRQIGKRPERVVRNVMLLYPSKDEYCFNRLYTDYIGLNPEIPFSSSDAYKSIKQIISENL